MDQSEHNLIPAEEGNGTEGESSSLELNNVKQVLSVKLEKPESHYTSISPLGKGSFGEVHSARDTLLGREVAIKSLKVQFRDKEAVVDRFLKEARGTAQLEHPNIMPVHELGINDDLGVFFTMKKIEGDNLKEILDRLESNTSFYLKKYPFSVLLEIFLAVCNGVAFAHSRGVIHRDLKPANIMIGEFGEVLILDWGLVKTIGTKEGIQSDIQLRMDEFSDADDTMAGAISGTPNYMSPEQAEGNVADVDCRSDIYSLGAILYHILTHLPPFERTQLRKLLENVKLGRFEPPRKRRPDLNIPREMEAICLKAMSRFQVNRYSSVERFADDVRNYIGHRDVRAYKAPRHIRFWKACRRNPVKSSVIAAVLVATGLYHSGQQMSLYRTFKTNLGHASELHAQAQVLLKTARKTYDDLQKERASTELLQVSEEEIRLKDKLAREVKELEIQFNQARAFFERTPDRYRYSKKNMAAYADMVKNRIDFAIYRGEYELARTRAVEVVAYYETSGRTMPDETRDYLHKTFTAVNGISTLEIQGSEAVKEVVVWPCQEEGVLITLADPVDRGKEFPFMVKGLIEGMYVVQASLTNGSLMSFPVYVKHGENRVFELEVPNAVPEGMVYIPGGHYFFGGKQSRFYRQREKELPGFFMKKYEVTVAEYLEFWKSLSDPELQAEYMSRIRFASRERRYKDAWLADGTLTDERLSTDYPVVGITPEAAQAFCEWKSTQLGATVRLPTIEEWEKAARGVDGRIYVWGNGFDATANLAHTKANAENAKFPYWAPPGKFSRDCSIYGVYDMAGNVREITASPLPVDAKIRQFKGGSFATPENFLPCSYSSDTPVVPSDVGFRYLMEMPK